MKIELNLSLLECIKLTDYIEEYKKEHVFLYYRKDILTFSDHIDRIPEEFRHVIFGLNQKMQGEVLNMTNHLITKNESFNVLVIASNHGVVSIGVTQRV